MFKSKKGTDKLSAECRMSEQLIQDWLVECADIDPDEINTHASSITNNKDLAKALYRIFEYHGKYSNLIERVSKQLFNYYRSKVKDLKLFTLQYLPNLIYVYLNSVAKGDKKKHSSVETLLIGIYNLEVVDDNGQPTVISFRLPSLAQASIYHEPMSLAHASLTESALRRLEECNTKLTSWGPHPQIETINAQNRLKTIAALLFIYNRNIGSLNKLSLKYLCSVSSHLAAQGFGGTVKISRSDSAKGSKIDTPPRIPVSPQFFLELLCGLYYAMYNDYGFVAMQAVVDIYNRSCLECYADVIIVANAIRNSSQGISKGQISDEPMGISVALSPATNTVTTVNKFMITNASFRTKKLPDDIPIIPKDESGSGADSGKPLTAITEEKEDTGFSARGSSLRGKETMAKNLQKLGIGKKLMKDKESKSSSKTNLAGGSSSDKKQSSSLSSFKEKMLLKSPVMANGDFGQSEVDGHGLSGSGKKKTVENGPLNEISNGGMYEEVATKTSGDFTNEKEESDALDIPLTNDDAGGLFISNKSTEDKPFMQVSSV